MLGLKGLATGIGSLPHKDIEKALDLIFQYTPEIPFWPQFTKRDPREGMVAQFSEGLPCIEVNDKGILFNPEGKAEKLEGFYEKIINQDIEYFKISRDFAPGLYAFRERLESDPKLLNKIKHIKCQITGPFTFAASIKDDKGTALLHNPEFMQAAIEALKMKALWQIKFFEKFGKSMIVFLDEPYLGCFGSAYTPINRKDVVEKLTEITDKISAKGKVLTGVHCCGNTDWSIFTDIKTMDIINFDAFSYLERLTLYSDNLQRFLQNRALCWGITPTQEFSEGITVDFLIEKINSGIDLLAKKGVDRELIKKELLISPSCGLGTLDVANADRIFALLSQLSAGICEKILKK